MQLLFLFFLLVNICFPSQNCKFQYSLKCNISRKKWIINFFFWMQINIKVFYMLILTFLVFYFYIFTHFQQKHTIISMYLWSKPLTKFHLLILFVRAFFKPKTPKMRVSTCRRFWCLCACQKNNFIIHLFLDIMHF